MGLCDPCWKGTIREAFSPDVSLEEATEHAEKAAAYASAERRAEYSERCSKEFLSKGDKDE